MGAAATGPLHGRHGLVKISTTEVAHITAWKLDQSVEEAEKTAMGDTGKSFLTGLKDATLTLSCWWFRADAGQTLAEAGFTGGTTVDVYIYPQDDFTSGAEVITGTGMAVISSNIDSSLDAVISGEFVFRGSMTPGTV